MSNETVTGLKRVSWLPDDTEPSNGSLIAGQEYWNVEFTGGSISNVTLTDVDLNGTETARNLRVVTASGAVTVASDDYVIVVNKTVGAATTVNLPAGVTKRSLIIKDGKGDAGTNNITLDGNASQTIDGALTYVIDQNYGAIEIEFNGTQWNRVGEVEASPGDVTSVNGQTGVVTLTTTEIAEGSNLYFTTERAQDATGAMVDTTLTYSDVSNGLGRAAITGDVTIAAGSNTAAIGTGVIVNADINASAAIDATKIADGSVSSVEFQTLNGIASNIQDQLDDKQDGIQYQDEGVNQGTAGGVGTVDFTGGGVTVTESAGTLTVNIPTSGSVVVDYIDTDGTTPTTAPSCDGASTDAMAIGNAASVVNSPGSIVLSNGSMENSEECIVIGSGSIADSTGTDSVVIGAGSISGNSDSDIVLGDGSITATSGYNAVIGGTGSQISGASDGCVSLGSGNSISGLSSASAFAGGNPRHSYSSGNFGISEGQELKVQLGVSTTNATPTVMEVGSLATTYLTIAASTVWTFEIIVTARRTNNANEGAGYKFEGVIHNNAGTTALIGTVVKTVLGESTAGWDADVTANNTNDSLDVTVTGAAASNIRWSATARITEAY